MTAVAAADKTTPPAEAPCFTAASTNCGVPASEMKAARKLYERGAKLRASHREEEALDLFERAARMVPRNAEFATAREMTRQDLVFRHIEEGNRLLAAQQRIRAMAEFRAAAALDPDNTFAQQRMRDAMPDPAPRLSPGLLRVERSTELRLDPKPGRHDFHVRGDAAAVYRAIGSAFGLDAEMDNAVPSRRLRFDVGDADFASAIAAAGVATKTFVVPIDPHRMRVLPDTTAMRGEYERQAMRTFYLSSATTPTALNDYVSTLRTVFDLQKVTIAATTSAIVVRGPQRSVDLASHFIEQTQQGAPQLMLDVYVFEVSRSTLRNIGIGLPLQFQMFDLAGALAALAAAGNQNLINQLISSGAINQANNQGIQALLAQLQNQQSSILNTPFATFGGGLTHFGVGIPAATANFSLNSTNVRNLEHMTIRAEQNDAATVRLGTRYPILNATFSPIFNTAALSQVLGNQSYIAPFPSFNYQDLGLSVKVTPVIHRTGDVSLKLEMQLQSLGGQSFNGIPTISNRQYTGDITVKDGEAAVLAGMVTQQDMASLSGVPGFSSIPVIGRLASTNNVQRTEAELLLTITPHIVSSPEALSPAMLFTP